VVGIVIRVSIGEGISNEIREIWIGRGKSK